MDAVFFLAIRILITLALYAFAGWAVFVIARDLKHQGELLEKRLPAPIILRVQGGPPVTFTRPSVSVGRDPGCDLCIDDLTVSSQHARFSYHHQQWWLEDLGSKNGTFLLDEKLSTPVVVTASDQVRFGQVAVDLDIG